MQKKKQHPPCPLAQGLDLPLVLRIQYFIVRNHWAPHNFFDHGTLAILHEKSWFPQSLLMTAIRKHLAHEQFFFFYR